jgi:carboxypeptidase Q
MLSARSSASRARTSLLAALILFSLLASPLGAQVAAPAARPAAPVAAPAGERVDLDAIHRIKDEAFQRSKVMEYASWLTDVHGPRLTNSPLTRKAAEYVMKEMTAVGLSSVQLEPWGPFGPGWVNDYTAVHVVEPQGYPLLAFPKAWTPGTDGVVRGEAMAVTLETDADLEKAKGLLRGAFVLLQAPREVKLLLEAPATRYTAEQIEEMTKQTVGPQRRFEMPPEVMRRAEFRRKRMAFLVSEGVAGVLEASSGERGDSGSVVVGGPAPGDGGRDQKEPTVPQLVLAAEHYNRIHRTLAHGVGVTIEADVRNRFFTDDLESFNIVGEIPGTDKADEVVIVGAHIDSWHAGTGATDNGGSSAVVMEVMRILKATGLKPRRTIRFALWTGEEQGLLGSRAYVQRHFAERETMTLLPGHAKLSAYFNMDNGGGIFRGIYLQGNDAVAPIFEAWMRPLASLGMQTLSIRHTGGTDHQAFDAVGLPGFQFIQDPLEYFTRTHHTNQDVYERLVPADLMANAVIMASFAYHAAMRDERLPRKPLPAPQPPRERPMTTTSTP